MLHPITSTTGEGLYNHHLQHCVILKWEVFCTPTIWQDFICFRQLLELLLSFLFVLWVFIRVPSQGEPPVPEWKEKMKSVHPDCNIKFIYCHTACFLQYSVLVENTSYFSFFVSVSLCSIKCFSIFVAENLQRARCRLKSHHSMCNKIMWQLDSLFTCSKEHCPTLQLDNSTLLFNLILFKSLFLLCLNHKTQSTHAFFMSSADASLRTPSTW